MLTGLHISAQRVVSLGTGPMGTKCEQNLKGNKRNSCFWSSLISVMIEQGCNEFVVILLFNFTDTRRGGG